MAGPTPSHTSEPTPSHPDIPPLPADATPEQKDAYWFKYMYQGDRMPQLTWRAVIMGGFLGMVMSAANLYTTLSIGWAFGIAITACVLSFVIWNFVRFTSGNKFSQMSVLENACMASCASAAGYSTGSTIATMFGALVLLKDVPDGTPLSTVKTWDVTAPWILVVFTLCTGLMGVFLAIPMKRQQINHEQLPFPSGIAAAETLRSLYSASAEAVKKAYVLVVGLAAGLLIGFLRVGDDVLDAVGFLKRLFHKISFLRIPEKLDIAIFDRLYPGSRHAQGFAFEPSALLIAAGMIVGMRISLSLLFSSLFLYGFVGPMLADADARHLSKGADSVIVAVNTAAAAKTPSDDHAARAEAAVLAATKVIDELKIQDAAAIKRAAARGKGAAIEGFERAKSDKTVAVMIDAARAANLDAGAISHAAEQAARDADEGPEKARSGAAIETAIRLAKAKGVSVSSIRTAADEAEAAAATATDAEVGKIVLKAVLEAAAKEKADPAKVQAAADKASQAARANPGREGAKAAKDEAIRIIYDEMENDPAAITAAADAAGGPANTEAAAKLSAAIVAAVVAESGKLGLDTAAIQAAATAAAKVAEEGAGKAEIAAATEMVTLEAKRVGTDPKPIIDAGLKATFDADEAKKAEKDFMATLIGGETGVAGVAGLNWANDGAIKAREEAKTKAKAEGKSFKQTKEAGEVAFESGKYKPNIRWFWGSQEIMITRWSLWGGTSIMVFSSLMSVGLQWRTLVRAFLGVRAAAHESGATTQESAALQAIEVPGSWMIIGMLPITIAMVWLQIVAFGVSWYAGVIAVAMSFVLSLVASRATGETDTTPIGAMGKVMQLMFAVLAPKNIAANLASAGIAANSASSSADLLTDLKTGYLLGANPRKQFLAQFFGCFFGTIAIVPIWYLMVPTREKLEKFALPSTRAWEAVARVLVKGVGELPPSAVYAIFIGAAIGMILPVIEKFLSPKARQYMPSATGIGLAWVMPFQNAFSFFLGAVVAFVWTKVSKKNSEHYNVPVASGLIAGESLMAAALAITATVVGIGKLKGWW